MSSRQWRSARAGEENTHHGMGILSLNKGTLTGIMCSETVVSCTGNLSMAMARYVLNFECAWLDCIGIVTKFRKHVFHQYKLNMQSRL